MVLRRAGTRICSCTTTCSQHVVNMFSYKNKGAWCSLEVEHGRGVHGYGSRMPWGEQVLEREEMTS
jgi:hypothetical protein